MSGQIQSQAQSLQLASKVKVRSILRQLSIDTPGIEGSALVSSDGLIVASVLSEKTDSNRFGAMCATLLALASRAANEIQRGDLRQVILEGANGPMLLTYVGTRGVLAVAAAPSSNLGRLILDARKIADQLAVVIEA